MVVASLWLPGVAAGEQSAYKGYCVDGKPVIEHWDPSLDDTFEPACDGNLLILSVKASKITDPNTPPSKPIEQPEDFHTWAFLWLNDKGIKNPYRDVRAFVTKSTGRTLIPIRVVTEAMGGVAEWNQDTWQVTVRLGAKYMTMTIGEKDAIANGLPIQLDQPPILWKDRTMVPARAVAEAFGAAVSWDERSFSVDIKLDGITCPDTYCADLGRPR